MFINNILNDAPVNYTLKEGNWQKLQTPTVDRFHTVKQNFSDLRTSVNSVPVMTFPQNQMHSHLFTLLVW